MTIALLVLVIALVLAGFATLENVARKSREEVAALAGAVRRLEERQAEQARRLEDARDTLGRGLARIERVLDGEAALVRDRHELVALSLDNTRRLLEEEFKALHRHINGER